MARNKDTKKAYIKRARQIMEKAHSEYKKDKKGLELDIVIYKVGPYKLITLSLKNTALWIKKNWLTKFRSSTIRQYRSSLIFMGEILLEKGFIDEKELNDTKETLEHIEIENKKNLPKRTSSFKQKSLKIKDLKLLGHELLSSKNKWGKLSYIWLYSGVLTGLRPIEWTNAYIEKEDDTISLIVKNAKNTNNRSHGEFRTINLDHLTEKQLNIVKQHLDASSKIKEQDDLWKQYYNGCSNLIRYHSRKIWKNKNRYPTLYSSRHQFSANLKASGCSKLEVATLMGHASDLTAQSHYGKKIHGTRGRKPKVNQKELKNVRQSNKNTEFKFKKD